MLVQAIPKQNNHFPWKEGDIKHTFKKKRKKNHPDLLTLTVREVEGKQTTLNQS